MCCCSLFSHPSCQIQQLGPLGSFLDVALWRNVLLCCLSQMMWYNKSERDKSAHEWGWSQWVGQRDFHPEECCSCLVWNQKSTLTYFNFCYVFILFNTEYFLFLNLPNCRVLQLFEVQGHWPSSHSWWVGVNHVGHYKFTLDTKIKWLYFNTINQ